MVEVFSSRYYLTQLHIVPYIGDRAIIDGNFAEYLRQNYADTYPFVFKLGLGSRHIPVYDEGGVPSETLALPKDTFSELNVSESEPSNVFLASENTADQLVSMNLVDGYE